MNIKDESQIFAIRVDQNGDSYFRAYVGQKFEKSGLVVTEVYQDMNELVEFRQKVYKVKVKTKTGTEFIWQKFENHKVQVTYRIPEINELDQINQLFEEGW